MRSKRLVSKGVHAVSFSDNPSLKGPAVHPQPPLGAAVEGLQRQQGRAQTVISAAGRPPAPRRHLKVRPSTPGSPACRFPLPTARRTGCSCGRFSAYPDLKIALSEGGIGWIPYLLERADFTFEHHHQWTHTDFGGRKPSDIFRRALHQLFIDDRFGIKNRHDIGIDIICYGVRLPALRYRLARDTRISDARARRMHGRRNQ